MKRPARREGQLDAERQNESRYDPDDYDYDHDFDFYEP